MLLDLLVMLVGCAPERGKDSCAVGWADVDADGFGDAETEGCGPGSVDNRADCDDTRADIHPGAAEICDGVDNNCDGAIDPTVPDNGDASAWADEDGDGYGNPAQPVEVCTFGGVATNADDCDDRDDAVYPGAVEVCNGVDDDCDGVTDPAGLPDAPTWYPDRDGDGYGSAGASVAACAQPGGHADTTSDCDDADADIHPGAPEDCLNGYDEDCDGYMDDFTGDCAPVPEPRSSYCDLSVTPGDEAGCVEGVAALIAGVGYSSVQAALDAVVVDDIVTICPGVHDESLLLGASPVTLVGFGASRSVLTSNERILELGAFAELSLVDLGFSGGSATYGAAIIAQVADLCIGRVSFDGGVASSAGGAIYAYNPGLVTVVDSTFTNNRSEGGAGAIYVGQGTDLRIESTTFEGNRSTSNGGAVCLGAESSMIILDSTFEGNEAAADGAAIDAEVSGASRLYMESTTFTTNRATDGGTLVLRLSAGAEATVVGSVFEGNVGEASVGAIDIDGSGTVVFAECDVVANEGPGTGGLYVGGDQRVALEGTLFVENKSDITAAAGTGIDGAELVAVGSTFWNNIGGSVGGVRLNTDVWLLSESSDWGSAATENTPSDVGSYKFDGVQSFECAELMCS